MIAAREQIQNNSATSLSFLWLEITGKCNLACQHCYAGSSPQGHHGRMSATDWQRVISQAAEMGCRSVQFIGGEPTVHPDLARLIRLAAEMKMQIEVYSNLVSIKSEHWNVFQQCHVQIATSFYSADASVHERITGGRYSFQKTVANIQQVLALGLPLRVGLVDMQEGQDIVQAKQFLRELGAQRVRIDQARGVGRGSDLVQVTNPDDALCGACAHGRAAIEPDGSVYPCVFSRHLTIGNVLHSSLEEIVSGQKMQTTRERLTRFFIRKFQDRNADCMPATEKYLKTDNLAAQRWCDPNDCDPNCEPGLCPPDVPSQCHPTHICPPDWMDPCPPIGPCPPDKEACPPDWDPPKK
jgi:Predicted Fe-S oxidoreductases